MKLLILPIYDRKVVLCRTIEEWDKVGKKHGEEPYTSRNLCGLSTVYRPKGKDPVYVCGVFDDSISTLAHELAHATFYILGDIGIPVKAGKNNEDFTWMLGYLMQKFLTVFTTPAPGGKKK